VLIVEQNVQQVPDLVDRAYLLEADISSGAAELRRERGDPSAYMGL
jgi:ABC-type branched-subunit amino acid transport system ATPase component